MKKILLIWMICGCMLLSACQSTSALPTMETRPEKTQPVSTAPMPAHTAPVTEPVSVEDMFTDRDLDDSYSDYVTITLADGASRADGAGVTVDGDTVTITKDGAYLVTGSLTAGQLTTALGEKDKVQIILSGVSITNPSTAALSIPQADKVFLTLAEGTQNSLTSTLADPQDSIDGALYAKCDLTLNGTGALTISSTNGHGLVCKKDLKMISGNYTVTAAKQGLSAKNSIRIADGSFTVTSGADGIHAEHNSKDDKGFVYICGGSFTIRAEGDGISASSTLTVLDGELDIVSGGGAQNAAPKSSGFRGAHGNKGMRPDGGNLAHPDRGMKGGHGNMDGTFQAAPPAMEQPPQMPTAPDADTSASNTAVSTKGLKAGGNIRIMGGNLQLDTADDGIHSGNCVEISAGTVKIQAGDDGIHADSDTRISGGTVSVIRSYEGIEGQNVVISDGEVSVTSTDDGINAAGGDGSGGDFFRSMGSIQISGGQVYVNAEGDGLDANGDLQVSGGVVQVDGTSVSGNGALDFDTSGVITGGTVLAASNGSMERNFGQDSTQGAILAALSAPQEAGTDVILLDASGQELLRFTPAKEFSSVNISSPEIRAGETYTLKVGTQIQTISMTGLIYGNDTGSMGHGNRGGF